MPPGNAEQGMRRLARAGSVEPCRNSTDSKDRADSLPEFSASRPAAQVDVSDRNIFGHEHPRLARGRTSARKTADRAARRRCRTPNCSRFSSARGRRGQTAVDLGRELLGRARRPASALLELDLATLAAHAGPRSGQGLPPARRARTRPPLSGAARCDRPDALRQSGGLRRLFLRARLAAIRTRCSPACSSTTGTA